MKEYVQPKANVLEIVVRDVLTASEEGENEIINDLNLNWLRRG
jgi:hypothetical protein